MSKYSKKKMAVNVATPILNTANGNNSYAINVKSDFMVNDIVGSIVSHILNEVFTLDLSDEERTLRISTGITQEVVAFERLLNMLYGREHTVYDTYDLKYAINVFKSMSERDLKYLEYFLSRGGAKNTDLLQLLSSEDVKRFFA